MLNYKQIFVLLVTITTSLAGKLELLDNELLELLDNESVLTQLIAKKQPLVVAFTADWCQVCQKIKPQLDTIAQEPEFAHIAFVRLDIDATPQSSQQYGIVAVPTIIFFNDGTSTQKMIGVRSLENFDQDMRSNLRTLYPHTNTHIDVHSYAPEKVLPLTTRIYTGIKNFLAQPLRIIAKLGMP